MPAAISLFGYQLLVSFIILATQRGPLERHRRTRVCRRHGVAGYKRFFLFIIDRKKDMIISGGANISPTEIEASLMATPFIADVAVLGAPDPEFKERIVAAIQPAEKWAPNNAKIYAWLDNQLARFKHPKIIDFHQNLPRKDSGRIFKRRLRKPYWDRTGRRI